MQSGGGMSGDFYGTLSDLYDVMIDWPARLKSEGPVLMEWLRGRNFRSVLDTACGTGGHVHYLAGQGFDVTGADISESMIRIAEERAAVAGRGAPRFILWPMDSKRLPELPPMDAVLCLGNSFPHLLDDASAARTFGNFHGLLRPGGTCVIQLKNLVRRIKQKDTFLPLARREREGKRIRFVRFYDSSLRGDRFLEFHWIAFDDEADGLLKHATTELRAWTPDQMNNLARSAGFREVQIYGDLKCNPFDPDRSEDMVVMATV